MSGSFHKQKPLKNYFRGPVRQRGSGIGSLFWRFPESNKFESVPNVVYPTATTARTEKDNNNNNIISTFEHFNKTGRFLVWSLLYLFCMELV